MGLYTLQTGIQTDRFQGHLNTQWQTPPRLDEDHTGVNIQVVMKLCALMITTDNDYNVQMYGWYQKVADVRKVGAQKGWSSGSLEASLLLTFTRPPLAGIQAPLVGDTVNQCPYNSLCEWYYTSCICWIPHWYKPNYKTGRSFHLFLLGEMPGHKLVRE